jgi:hypothetical protein
MDGLAGQRRPARQGQHRLARRHVGAAARRRQRLQAARGLGLDARGDRRLPAGVRRGGVQAALHTDTLNEAGFVETRSAAIAGRSIHAYHTEGAGGGHAPDIITVAGRPNVLPSSTNPTRPHTVNTVDEHLDMLMVCHHLNPSVPEDLAFAESRIRPVDDRRRGRAARPRRDLDDRLRLPGHGPGRRGRHPHVADRARHEAPPRRARPATATPTTTGPALRRQVHDLPGDGPRPRREIGSVEVGKLADLVLWDPVLRRAPARRGQGRHDRLGADGRRQRVDPHAAAGAAPADVRRVRSNSRPDLDRLRVPGRGGQRPGRQARVGAPSSSPSTTAAG